MNKNGFVEKAKYIDVTNAMQKEIDELKDFAIWLTGCGYDFTQHKYFIDNRHILAD